VTPRTEAGRAFLATVERAVLDAALAKMLGGDDGKPALVALVSPDTIRDAILAIEREAGSTDALRAALERLVAEYDDDTIRPASWISMKQARAALAASDAGTATRSYIGRVRDTEERLIAESLRTDAGPAGIDVERLAEALHEQMCRPVISGIASGHMAGDEHHARAILARLSRESDR
jgi:hypothetical protein